MATVAGFATPTRPFALFEILNAVPQRSQLCISVAGSHPLLEIFTGHYLVVRHMQVTFTFDDLDSTALRRISKCRHQVPPHDHIFTCRTTARHVTGAKRDIGDIIEQV